MKNFLRTSIFVVSLALTFTLNRLSAQSITYGRSFDMTDGVIFAHREDTYLQDLSVQGVTFSADGYKVFTVGDDYDQVYAYTLTTPFSLSGEFSHDGSPLSITTEETAPQGLGFSSDGKTMFVIGYNSDEVQQYSLSTAYDITSTVTHLGAYNVSTETGTPSDIAFNDSGSKMYITAGRFVFQYTLSTPFDVTNGLNVTYNGSYSSSQDSNVKSMALNPQGTKMFLLGSTSDAVYQYSLSTPYVVTSGVTYDGVSTSVAQQETFPTGIAFNPDGNKFFITGDATNGILEYDVFDGGFTENDANDGSVAGAIQFSITGETFTNAGATMTPSTHYTITNLPAGLTPTLSISGDGLSGNLLLSGKATTHQSANSIASLQFTFTNAAFTGGSAASVTNAVSAGSGYGIQFNTNYPQLFYGDFFDLSAGATFSGSSATFGAQEGTPGGLAFSRDGLKMFIVGSSSDKVHQYSLALPFKVTGGVTNNGSPLSIVAQDDGATGIAFSKDGLRMFITGANNKSIYQYSLNSSFDITSGATYIGAFSLAIYEATPQGLAFSTNGKKLFVIGSGGKEVNQFTLSAPYDITNAVSPDGLFSVSAQETSATGLAFSYDGRKMFVIGMLGIDVNQYSLTFPFDITTGVTFDGSPFSVSGQEIQPRDLAFSPDGSTLFVVGSHGDDVNSYQLPVSGFTETAANDGTVEGSVKINIFDDKFTNAGGSLTSGSHYTINNLPSGLSSSMAVAADGLSATLTLSGTAALHQNINDLSSLSFTFENGAFLSGNRSLVVGAFAAKSNFGIDFEANVEVIFGNAFSMIDGATFNNSAALYAASTDDYPRGLAFNADGTRMYVVGPTDKEIYMLSVSTPFRPDLGYGVGFTPFSVSSEDVSPKDIAFSADGLKMFVLGHATKRIFEYNLTNPFNISSGTTYSGSYFSASSLDSAPTSIALSQDGSKMFLTGATGDKVYQINLAIPFSISTATNSGNFVSVSAQETNPVGVSFNTEGTRMFVYGTASNAVHQYSLQNPFDLSSGVTASNVSINVSPEGAGASGFTFAGDGKSFIFSTYQKLAVYTLAKDGFKESPDNDGNVAGRLVTNVRFDTFVNAGSTLSIGTHYSLSAVPAGLTPVMTVSGDGYSATLTFTGTATNHQDVNDIDEIDITFTDAAFTTSDAADVLNATN
ncbi:MAG: hypothetical protein RIE59_20975, partial [Imperialibacter sp.]